MNNLTSKQYQILENCFIPRELADETKYKSFGDIEMAERLSRTPKAGVDLSCFGKPIFSPFDLKNPREWVYRLNNPEKEKLADGTIKEKNKYLRPKGAKNMLDFQPNITPEMLDDVNLDILYCETSKGMLACYRLSQLARKDWLVIGQTGGCWGFRGKVEKAADENGVKHDISGVIPDLNQINWQGRKVTIIYDADAKSNPKVKNAQSTLAKTLQGFGAVVYIVDLPEIEATASIDDVLAFWERQHGLEKAVEMGLKLIESAKPFEAETGRKSATDSILELAESLSYFHTVNNEGFAIVETKNIRRILKVRSKDFRDYLSRLFYQETGKAIASQSLQDAINTLNAKANFDYPTEETHIRFAEKDGEIFIDICNERRQVIRANKNGWSIIESADTPVYFRQTRGQMPLPIPVKSDGEDSEDNEDAYLELFQFINTKEEERVLLSAFILAAMRPNLPFPILIVHGGQGSGKSTLTRFLKNLIDPNISPLRSQPKDERDLMIAAKNGWLLSFDNLDSISNTFSNSLCRLSTGGGLSGRELYSDDDEIIFDAMRPVIINGITEIATRPDLLERSLTQNLPTVAKANRKSVREIEQNFEDAKPRILGGFLDKLCEGLRNLENVKLAELPRMADFALLGYAAFGEDFINRYSENQDSANEIVLENSVIAEPLLKFLSGLQPSNENLWNGTSGELLDAISNVASEKIKNLKSFPKQPNVFSGQIKRIEGNLREAGFNISRGEGSTTEKRKFYITRLDKQEKSSSSSSAQESSGYKTNGLASDNESDNEMQSDNNHCPNSNHRPNDRPTTTVTDTIFNGFKDSQDNEDDEFPTFSNGIDYSHEGEEFTI